MCFECIILQVLHVFCRLCMCVFFFSSRRRHTRCALVTGVQTCALPIYSGTVSIRERSADLNSGLPMNSFYRHAIECGRVFKPIAVHNGELKVPVNCKLMRSQKNLNATSKLPH